MGLIVTSRRADLATYVSLESRYLIACVRKRAGYYNRVVLLYYLYLYVCTKNL